MRRVGRFMQSVGLTVASLLAVAAITAQGGMGSPADGGSTYVGDAFSGEALVIPGVESLVGGQLAAAQRSRRANPEAVASRERSRTAYEHLLSAAVGRFTRKALPSVIAPAPSGLTHLPAKMHVVRYLGEDAAQLVLPSGKHVMAASMTPIAASASGSYAPVNLSLKQSQGAFAPTRSAVPVRIAKELSGGARLISNGVSLTPITDSSATQGDVGSLQGAAVLYPNTQKDTDTAIKATTSGFETYTLLRSLDSPQRLSYRVGLPKGARLTRVRGHSGDVQIVAYGRVLAVIPASTAVDAAGMTVPVSTSVSGHTLRLTVAHRAGDYLYPIVVDPTVMDSDVYESFGTTNWRMIKGGPSEGSHFGGYYNVNSWYLYADWKHETNEFEEMAYPTQGESRIYALAVETSAALTASNIVPYIGIYGSTGWENGPTMMPSSYGRTGTGVCTESGCGVGGSLPENVASFYLASTGTGESGEARLYSGTVYIYQANGPTIKFDTTSPYTEYGFKNIFYGSGGWLKRETSAAQVDVTDPGVGAHEVQYTLSNGEKWTDTISCAGHVECPKESKRVIFYASNPAKAFPAGEPTLEAKVINAMGSSATTSIKFKVDNEVPTELALTGVPTGGEIGEAYHALKLTGKAKDGSGTTPSSGIESLKLAIDGHEVGSPSGTCSPGPCTATGEWTINAEEYAAGKHTFTLTATDKAGNVAKSETPFSIHHASSVPLGPGTINPISGEFDFEESDVSIATSAAPLAVTRAYDSREPTAGSTGPMGSPWTISFGGAQSIEEDEEGNAILTDAGGQGTVFTYKFGGPYTSPPGDSTLILTKTESGFTLTDKGAKTTFAHVTGDRENVWRPTITTGTGGTSSTLYTYQVVSGTIEPLEELAPVPVGVTCATELKAGCRALTFNYATSTTATGESPSEWGDYKGHLTRVYFTAYEPAKKEMQTTTVEQYAYDKKGRLRAVWDPRVSPALKTTYGYDSEGHLTSMSSPGQQPWILGYGTTANDSRLGRLVSAGRPVATTALGNGKAPANTAAPTLSTVHPLTGKAMSVVSGAWANSPLRYGYQWERCNSSGAGCAVIGGAINREYTPTTGDVGSTLAARVTATNAAGAVASLTSVSAVVSKAGVAEPQQVATFGSSGTGNGQLQSPWGIGRDSKGNVWVADSGNNRIEEFNSEGGFVRVAGTSGSGLLADPEDLTVDASGNVWVTDTGKSRVVEFNAEGTYVRAFGTSGTGNGQFKSPWGIAVDASNHVWVVDAGNNRVQEFSSEGTFIRTFGSEGTGNGQFKGPGEVSIDSKGNVWVADTSNNRVQEFSSEGTYIKQFGSSGSGNGQFCSPWRLAVDPNNDEIWVADACNNRVQVFSPEGAFITKFGSSGSGSGQFSSPEGIVFSLEGYVYILDKGNSRVSKWSDGAPTPVSTFGSYGSGNGQMSYPWGIARDSKGNVWVADTGNARIDEFNEAGAFVRTAGTSGAGTLGGPEDVTTDSAGDAWVTDTRKNRVVEFSPEGVYLRAFGSEGTGNGQFKSPWGIAVDSSNHVWVVDAGNDRVQEFSSEGTFIRALGSEGSGNGQFSSPGEVALDSKGNVWVTDFGNSRVEEFSGEGTYIRQFGSKGSGNGQFCSLWRLAIDPSNNQIWTADACNSRIEVFTPTGEYVEQFGGYGTGLGQLEYPEGIAFSPSGYAYVLDADNNRIVKWNDNDEAVTTSGEETALPQSASSTVEYGVPVSGTGAPYSMSSTEVAKWAQTDTPTEATAIFPPDESVAWPAANYRRATVDYFDVANRLVNVAEPGGAISTSEYNSYNDVARTLSADNRETALKEGAKSAEVSQTLDTQSTYGSEGTELLSRLGPIHSVKLASGTTVSARKHTVYSYDENAPSLGGPYRLVTKETVGAQIAGEPEADVRTTTRSYAGQNNLGWVLRKPTAVRTDPSGLKLTHTTVYDPTTGDVTETRTPAAGAPGEEVFSGYIYKSKFWTSGIKPAGIAVDKEGNVWVADTEVDRIEEYSSGGTLIRSFGEVGTANGRLKTPEGIAIDPEGNVWVADTGNNRIQEFSNTGTFILSVGASGTKWGEFKAPVGIAYVASGYGSVYVADTGDNYIRKLNKFGETEKSFGGTGSGNGQLSKPEGVAVDSSGDVWVADTGNNRVQEFSSTGTYMKQFGTVGSGNGNLSKPEGLAVDTEGNVLVADSGNNRIEGFSSSGSYLYQYTGKGEEQWLKAPAGLALDTANNAYVIDTGDSRVLRLVPAGSVHESSGTGGTHGMQTIYYTAGENTQVYACGNHPEWAGLPCETKPAAQPGTSGVPNLPVTTVTYDMWEDGLVETQTVGSATRTTTNTYDAAGRILTETESSSEGTALPTVTAEYNPETGSLGKLSTTVEGTTRSVEAVFNTLGQTTSYKDADGNVSTFTYDIDGRLESENDGKGTQSLAYDSTTGFLSKLTDSGAGTFTGTYDAEGNLLTAGYPNGMNVNRKYNSTGTGTSIEYVKTTNCSSACTWYSDSIVPSIHGQTVSQSSTFSSQAYTYDAAGRLTKTQDTPSGEGCTTRVYALDEETNITSLTTRPPGTGGSCATEGGSAQNHSYDSANRLTDAGISYDNFGDITKLPATDAGGTELASTFYSNGTIASRSQNGETIGYYLDPVGRPRLTVSTGTTNSTVTSHYAGEGGAPSWTEDSAGKWTRNISGIGDELVATQIGGQAPVLQVENLHGDVVATMPASETATGLSSKNDPTEYGVPRTGSSPKYSWLGAQQVPTELPSGVISMGARSYVPELGRFQQPDPIEGGSANAYAYTYGDPVNTSDPTGEFTVPMPSWAYEFSEEFAEIATEEAIQRAAEEQAAREEAEEKAREAAEEAAEAAAEAAEAAAEASAEASEGSGGGGGGKKGKGKKPAKQKITKPAKITLRMTEPPAKPGHKNCLPGEVRVGNHCEKGPGTKHRPKLPKTPPPGSPTVPFPPIISEGIEDCMEIGVCDI